VTCGFLFHYHPHNRTHALSHSPSCTLHCSHIIPEDQPGYDPALQNQNFKDRYYGNNDPVAEKMLRRAAGGPGARSMAPPPDKSITSLWVGGVRHPLEQRDMYDTFSAYGEIREVRMIPASQCCFVHFVDRETAEKAASSLQGKT
jgi:pre-mRNA-splicing factor RBM22/SLT11